MLIKIKQIIFLIVLLTINACQTSKHVFLETKTIQTLSNSALCFEAINFNSGSWNDKKGWHIAEAKRRGLDCGVKDNGKTEVVTNTKTNNYSPLKNYSNSLIITNACSFNGFKYTNFKSDIVSNQYVKEAKRRGLDCSVGNSNKTVIASKPKTYTQSK